MYFAPIFKPRIMSPLTGFLFICSGSPGFRRSRGFTAGLPYTAPRRGSDFGGHSPAAQILPCLGVEIEPQASLEASARSSGRHFK